MKNNILNLNELKQRLAYLNSEKTDKEELIKYHTKDLYESFDPVNIIKHNITRILKDEEIQSGVISVLLSKGAGFIAKKIFNKHESAVKHPSSNLFEKISGFFSGEKKEEILGSFGDAMRRIFARR
jgi:hypothetical protein